MEYKGNFIGGEWVIPKRGAKALVSENPGDLDHPVGEILFSREAVQEAVSAAQGAFPRWSALSERKRMDVLFRFRRILKQSEKHLALLITREMGKTLKESQAEADRLSTKIDTAKLYEMELVRSTSHDLEKGVKGRLRFRPRGVIAILSPFNVPAHLACSPAISAMLTGNTVVLKPSELTPFVGQFLASLWKAAGLPQGVFNLVQGGAETGQALVSHPGVQAVIFTGSWKTGLKIQEEIQNDPHKMGAFEMGGKNSAIICRDAELGQAVDEAVFGAFLTTGQRCNATSRILVERPLAKKFVSLFLRRTEELKIGYGEDPQVFMGPVVSKGALERVSEFMQKAPKEGFQVLRKGGELSYPKRGYYLKPSVHLREGEPASPVKDDTYTDDEILGPDAAIYVVKNLEEALKINNRPHYGLVVSVFSRSRKNFEKVLREAENGLVHWNVSTVRSSPRLPFWGMKRSGNFRPAGFFTPYLCTVPTASIEREW
ncbi:MAG: aldehyde dehydrogenase family protein [Candidatus Omnitrophica bacterium]|nr:aldehyde dehydrogenase family protein [Candidatus Omnitrophota bacterium]